VLNWARKDRQLRFQNWLWFFHGTCVIHDRPCWDAAMTTFYPQKISVPPFQSSNFRPIWGKLGPTVLQRSIYTLLWQQQQRSLALNRSADWHRLTMINFSAGAVTGLPAPAQSRYSKRSSLSETSEPSESEYNLPPWRSRQTSFSSARILRS
jgi:hypothetical protein